MANITIVGAGYVGLVTGVCFAELGNNVTLIEIDNEKLAALGRGQLPVSEPRLPELWERNRSQGRLSITGDYAVGLAKADFVFIAVGTPSAPNGSPDLRWVRLAAKKIVQTANRSMIVVVKSTVPVGTADMISRIIARSGKGNFSLPVVSNPEFLREGDAVSDFMNPLRVVVGGIDQDATNAVAELYSSVSPKTIVCDNGTAEMSKYASNVFLATRISFINEIAELCEAYGIDVVQVQKVVGAEPRIGSGYLRAGLGWGGSCLPKDIRGIIHMARGQRVPLNLLKTVKRINDSRPRMIVSKLRRLLGGLEGKTIGILGLAFKANTDDMREACSISLVNALTRLGCRVKGYDPQAMLTARKVLPAITYCVDAYEVARDSDALILVTEWNEFKALDMRTIALSMANPVLLDSQNFYDPAQMAHCGLKYEGIGHPAACDRDVELTGSPTLAGD